MPVMNSRRLQSLQLAQSSLRQSRDSTQHIISLSKHILSTGCGSMVCFDGLPLYKDLHSANSAGVSPWCRLALTRRASVALFSSLVPSFAILWKSGQCVFLNHSTRRVQTCHVSDVGFQ